MRTRWIAPVLAMLAGCPSNVAGGGSPLDCPRQEPSAGQACDAMSVCDYGAGTCPRSYACTDGTWQSVDEGCTPPPPPPGPCPMSIPTMGAPCHSQGQECDFKIDGTCPGLFVATCGANGWAVSDQSPPCMPPPCPMDEPMAGAACGDYPLSCTYVVTPPGCPPETQDANCTNGVWTIQTSGTCPAP